MTPTTDPLRLKESRRSQRAYVPRLAGLALGGLCVGATLVASPQAETWLWALLLTNALVWPHMAYFWPRYVANPHNAEMNNLLIDSLMGGFWFVAMQGSLLPSVLLITMLMMNNILVGGLRLLRRGALALLLGTVIGLGIFGWDFRPESTFPAQVFSLIFLVIYPMVVGKEAYKYAQQLKQRVDLLELGENDTLSGMHNRHFFMQKVAGAFANYQRHHHPASLIVANLLFPGKVSDPSAGDAAISKLGHVFTKQVRATDSSARIDSDTFAVLMPLADVRAAHELTMRLQSCFQTAIADAPHLSGATLNFGIAASNPDMQSYEDWLENADKALRLAQASHRDGA